MMVQVKPLPLRKQQKNYTRQRLIEVARELFVQKGIQETGIDDIAKAAGTSRATVYTHFGGKTEIIRELVAEIWETVQSTCEEYGAMTEWTQRTMRAWLSRVFERCEKYAESTRMVLREAPSDVMNETEMRLRSNVEAMMGAGQMWTHLAPDEARLRARLLLIQLFRSMWMFQAGNWDTNRDALLDTLADVWLATVQADKVQGKA